jgi:tRNA threonylcarbamoyladenosine biosynthesis protein TsaE
VISSSEEMKEFGRSFGEILPPNSLLALSGDLGSGKTTFVQGLALGMGIQDPIQSPTFVFLNRYMGRLPLFHFDLYRMKGLDDFLGLGFDEVLESLGVVAIEWPERISSFLPKSTHCFSFSYLAEGRVVEYETAS